VGSPSGQIPSFFDRSIGGIFGGTPTPVGARQVLQQDLVTWEEDPDSPQIEFAEQGTIRHSFKTDYQTALGFALNNKRGTILTDSNNNVSRVLSCSLNYLKGDMCQVVVVAESLMTVDLPPQEFSIEPIEFNPSIEKHPRYFIYDPSQSPPYVILTPFDLFLCKNQIQGQSFFTQQTFETLVSLIPNPNDPYTSQTSNLKRQAAAAELIQKMLLGIESPYIPAFRVTWSEFFFYGASAFPGINPNLNPGGFVQDPTDVIPPQFWSVDGSGAPNTNILLPFVLGGAMDTTKCPTFYDRGISWLREADSIVYQRTWFKITSVWIGGPIGQFDPDVYSQSPSPYLP
jgi:hypothetical protein